MNPSRRDFLQSVVAVPVLGEGGGHDVVVYGGVPCGIAAAIAAARAGARVLLIEPTKHVGGLSTSGINTAETEHMLVWTTGGIALEFYGRLGDHYQTGKPEFYFESSVAEKVYLAMLTEAGVEIRYGARVEKVARAGRRLTRMTLSDDSMVFAKVFIDAGYEGDLMARAGVSYVYGREATSEFNEEAAGVRFEKTPVKAVTVDGRGRLLPGITCWAKELQGGGAHRGVMNYNFRPTFTQALKFRVPIPKPERYDPRRFALLENWLLAEGAANRPVALRQILDLYARRNGKFEVNNKPAAIIPLGHFGRSSIIPTAPTSGGRKSSPITGITRSGCSTFWRRMSAFQRLCGRR